MGGGVVNTGRPLQVKYWGGHDPCNPCGVDAYEGSAFGRLL